MPPLNQSAPRPIRPLRRPGPARETVAAPADPFWDCRLSPSEILLLAVFAVMAMALHLGPVLHSALGTPLIYLIAGVSYLSPVTGFAFIAASQFLPFPDQSVHNPAQAGVIMWLPVVLLRYQRLRLTSLGLLWPVVPWMLWIWLTTGQDTFNPYGDYVKSMMYSMIACQLANESRGQYMKCLLGLSFGALLVMCAYWGLQMGLPIEISDWGQDREGETRMGGVRADAVMVWPALLMGISGLLGIQIALASPQCRWPSPRWLTILSLLFFVMAFPPLVSTMSHGAFAGLACVVLAVVVAIWKAGGAGAFTSARFRGFTYVLALSVVAVVFLFAIDAFSLRTKTMKLQAYYESVKAESGAAASRSGVWHDSIHTILTHPLLGLRPGEHEVITSEYADMGYYLSHNIFLDFGRQTGIPGMLLLAFFFFFPAVRMWLTGSILRYLPFLLAHFAMLIFWMSLSFTFYKTFWALWMLMAMVASRHPVPQRRRRPPFGDAAESRAFPPPAALATVSQNQPTGQASKPTASLLPGIIVRSPGLD